MIQIRNVPDALHRRLKSRAAEAGMSLSEYLLSEIRRVSERPTLEEMLGRIRQRGGLKRGIDTAALIREERDRR